MKKNAISDLFGWLALFAACQIGALFRPLIGAKPIDYTLDKGFAVMLIWGIIAVLAYHSTRVDWRLSHTQAVLVILAGNAGLFIAFTLASHLQRSGDPARHLIAIGFGVALLAFANYLWRKHR